MLRTKPEKFRPRLLNLCEINTNLNYDFIGKLKKFGD